MTGSLRVVTGNNISIVGAGEHLEKSNNMVVQHRNFPNSHGDSSMSPGGSNSTGSASFDVPGHRSPVSLCSNSDSEHNVEHETSTLKPKGSPVSDCEEITKLHHHDCILGRGGFTNNYVGNANFRKLVNQHKMRYLSCNKIEKPKVAREVVRLWKQLDPPGRFLQKKDDGNSNGKKGAPIVWVQCPDKKAQEKASQSLRERTPDVLPYLTKLQEHRDQIREKGMSMISQHYQGSLEGSEHLPTGSECASGLGSQMDNHLSMHASLPRLGMDQSLNSSINGCGNGSMMHPREIHCLAMNANRRMSMPVGGGTQTGRRPPSVTSEDIRAQMPSFRRTSMPAVHHLQGRGLSNPGMIYSQHYFHSQGMMGPYGISSMAYDVERHRQQVLQEAYNAVESHGNCEPQAKRLFMEQIMMREQESLMRGNTLQQAASMHGSVPAFVGSSNPLCGVTRNCDIIMPEHQSMMLAAAQKQQQLLQESMKDPVAERKRPEINPQKMDPDRMSGTSNAIGKAHSGEPFNRTQHPTDCFDIEPLPLDVEQDEFEITLSIVPEMAESSQEVPKRDETQAGNNIYTKDVAVESSDIITISEVKVKDAENHACTFKNSKPGWKVQEQQALESISPITGSVRKVARATADAVLSMDDTMRLSSTTPAVPGKLKSALKNRTAEGLPSNCPDGTAAEVNEYRKTLEDYMTNHQNTATGMTGTVDIDDDISEGDVDIGGIDALAWIHQALHSSVDTSFKNGISKRKKKRRSSQDPITAEGLQQKESNHDSGGLSSSYHTINTTDLMSTDGKSLDCGKSMDCKSLDNMSFISLALSEMEKSMEQLHVNASSTKGMDAPGAQNHDDDSDVMEDESINFGSHHEDLRKRGGMSSNQSVMSELTDFSDNGDNGEDDDDVLGFERDIII